MSIDRLDVPAERVASDMADLIARQRQQLLNEELRLVQEHDLDPVDALFLHIADNWGPVSLIKNRPGRAT